jgi:hypothetical protein
LVNEFSTSTIVGEEVPLEGPLMKAIKQLTLASDYLDTYAEPWGLEIDS